MAVSPRRAPARPKRPDIQGLRGIAVALVVLFHAGLPFPGGFTGVDVFFAISGFVITSSLVAELERDGRLSLTRFYARRVRRLLPALATMIVVVTALGTLATPVGAMHITALTGLFASTFGANVYLSALPQGYFGASTTLDPFLHTWTLAVEEQFYVVVPALLLGAWLLGRSRPFRGASRLTALAAVAALTAASFELAVRTLSEPAAAVTFADRFGFYGAPARAWEFGGGALLALVFPLLRRVPAFAATAAGTCGLAAVCFAGFAIHGQASFSAWEALLPVGGACLLMAAGAAPENMCSALLAVRPLTWIGDRSYSWYLWHWPLIVFARGLAPGSGWVAPVAAAISLVPASLSYRYVENPIRYHP